MELLSRSLVQPPPGSIVCAHHRVQARSIGAPDAAPHSRVSRGLFATTDNRPDAADDSCWAGLGPWADMDWVLLPFGSLRPADGFLTDRLATVSSRGIPDLDSMSRHDAVRFWRRRSAAAVYHAVVVRSCWCPRALTSVLGDRAGALTATRYRFRYAQRRMSNS